MYARALILLLIASLGTSCTYRDPSIDLLEGELRWMEDQLFTLEDELEMKCAELASCRSAGTNDALLPTPADRPYSMPEKDYTIMSDELLTPEPSVDLPPLDAPDVRFPMDDTSSIEAEPSVDLPTSDAAAEGPDFSFGQPSVDLPPTTNPDAAPYRIVEPSIELPPNGDELPAPTPAGPSPLEQQDSTLPLPGDPPELNQSPEAMQPPTQGGSGNDVQLQSFSWEESPRVPATAPSAIDAHVTHVVVHAEITNASDFDDKPTDPGLLIIIEPRNSDGAYVALAGKLAVVVLDGNQHGSAARVARWDFDAATARRRIRSSRRGNGIHLVLPWPEAPPESDDLHLFVRYTTVEGRLLEADRLLEKGRSSQRWNVTRRNAASWSSARAKPGVRIPTSPLQTSPAQNSPPWQGSTGTLPAINPDELQLQPIPTAAQQPPAIAGSIATASYEAALETNGVSLATVPIPPEAVSSKASPAWRESRSESSTVPIEMPVVRHIQRPKWKPYR